MAEIIMSPRAFTKPIFHAAKYPHCSVNGVFVGKKDGTNINVADAIPLFHSNLTLAPMLEVALFQIDTYCQLNNLSIIGYYQANEIISDIIPNPIANKIADKIKEYFSEAFLLMINNEEVLVGGDGVYILHNKQNNKWSPSSDRLLKTTLDTIDTASSLVASKTFRLLNDFDDHLDDLNNDWLNSTVNQAIITTA